MNPDALFGFKNRKKPDGQNRSYFFLEIVRPRESEYPAGRVLFHAQDGGLCGLSPSRQTRKAVWDKQFRVITVTPRDGALRICGAKLQKAGLASARFWFTDLETRLDWRGI